MRSKLHLSILALATILLLSACHSAPEHAKYIPKDAAAVIGINTNSIQKKLAWSAITGSKLLDEMKENQKGKDALNGIEDAGINWSSTLYVYARADKRFSNETKMTALIPISDTKKLEAYIKKIFPEAVIKPVNKRSETLIDKNVYAAWDDKTLMVMNTIVKDAAPASNATPDTLNGMSVPADIFAQKETDETATAAEMEASFNLPKDASLLGNSRFTGLEKEGHDVEIWASYDAIMDSYGAKQGMNAMSGLNMGSSLWKNAATTAGFDFDKGTINGLMRYFPGDDMRDVAHEMGKENVDKDMLGRLNGDNLDLLTGYHLSPTGLKMMLDKMGLTGMANMALAQKNMNTDDILGAFTGDIVFAMNNFSITSKNVNPDAAVTPEDHMAAAMGSIPKMDMLFAMKIKNKASFDKLISFAAETSGLEPSAPNTYSMPIPSGDTITIITGDTYFVVSNHATSAQAFIASKSGKIPEIANKEIAGHPVGLYVDAQQFLSKINPGNIGSGSDSSSFIAIKNLFSNITMNGGEFKGDAADYHVAVNFVNKDENSLLQLLHFAQLMNKAHAATNTTTMVP